MVTKIECLGWNLEKGKKFVAGSTSNRKIAIEFGRKRTRNVRYMWDQRKWYMVGILQILPYNFTNSCVTNQRKIIQIYI